MAAEMEVQCDDVTSKRFDGPLHALKLEPMSTYGIPFLVPKGFYSTSVFPMVRKAIIHIILDKEKNGTSSI